MGRQRTPALLMTALVAVAAGITTGTATSGEPPPRPASSPAAVAPSATPVVALEALGASFDKPVYVTAPPGDASRLFVVEKTGRIRVLKDGILLKRPFLDVSGLVSTGGEQGLLSMAFHPRYATNGRFYVNYTNRSGDTRVVRYRVSADDADVADANARKVLLRVAQPYANHNGGQLQFGPDGRLYVGLGDGGGAGDPEGRAQDPRSRHGKILRVTLGTSPLKVGVYARGLRNPWRFSFDRETGALWIGDVGQNAREEIDRLRSGRPAGANLGWNGYEGTRVYDRAAAARLDTDRLVWPVSEYGHDVGRSVTGGYVYRGAAIPELQGRYVFGDFVTGRVWAMDGPRAPRRRLTGADGQVSQLASFGEDAAGEVYLVSLAGTVYKIVPATP